MSKANIEKLKSQCIHLEKALPGTIKKWDNNMYENRTERQINERYKLLCKRYEEYDILSKYDTMINQKEKKLLEEIKSKEEELKILKNKLKHIKKDIIEKYSKKEISADKNALQDVLNEYSKAPKDIDDLRLINNKNVVEKKKSNSMDSFGKLYGKDPINNEDYNIGKVSVGPNNIRTVNKTNKIISSTNSAKKKSYDSFNR
jgi:DNA repair exonuclease SbcCD ATPase subunit